MQRLQSSAKASLKNKTNSMIISLSGVALAGKDEVAKMIKNYDNRFQIKGFSQKLKEIAVSLTGIPYEHWEDQSFKKKKLEGWDMDARTFMQKLGTEAIRNGLHPDAWVMALMSEFRQGDYWVVKDCRFANEYEMMLTYDAATVQVIRPGYREVNDHISERSLHGVCFDHYIMNEGSLQDLEDNVHKLMSDIGL